MRFIDYKDWADYIYSIYTYFGIKAESILEIGAGTCNVAKHLSQHFKNIVVVDVSKEMLREFTSESLLKICADMTNLPIKKKFSFIYSTFDSVNYLLNMEMLYRFFSNIEPLLTDNGILTFDVSLITNSKKNLRHLNRKGIHNGIKYSQKSHFDEQEKIHFNYFKVKLESGEIIEETHAQKIFDFFEYFDVVEKTNLYVSECFNAFTFDNAHGKSDRAQFIIRKRKN
ncbi:MAG: methyltransferase domain-containing protein [bacterium]